VFLTDGFWIQFFELNFQREPLKIKSIHQSVVLKLNGKELGGLLLHGLLLTSKEDVGFSLPEVSFKNVGVTLIKCLGEGSTSICYEGAYKQKKIVVKWFRVTKLSKLEREFKMLNTSVLKYHPKIVPILGISDQHDALFFGIIGLHLLTQPKDFKQNLKPLNGFHFMELLDFILFLQSKKIIHRDLKPSNMYLTENGKLITNDYGSAIHLDEKNIIWNGDLKRAPFHVLESLSAKTSYVPRITDDLESLTKMVYQYTFMIYFNNLESSDPSEILTFWRSVESSHPCMKNLFQSASENNITKMKEIISFLFSTE